MPERAKECQKDTKKTPTSRTAGHEWSWFGSWDRFLVGIKRNKNGGDKPLGVQGGQGHWAPGPGTGPSSSGEPISNRCLGCAMGRGRQRRRGKEGRERKERERQENQKKRKDDRPPYDEPPVADQAHWASS